MRHTVSHIDAAYLAVCLKHVWVYGRARYPSISFGIYLRKGKYWAKENRLAVNNAAVANICMYVYHPNRLASDEFYIFLFRPSFGNSGVEFYRGHRGNETLLMEYMCRVYAVVFRIYITTITSNVNYDKFTTRILRNSYPYTFIVQRTQHSCYVYNTLYKHWKCKGCKHLSFFLARSLARLVHHTTHYVRLVHFIFRA